MVTLSLNDFILLSFYIETFSGILEQDIYNKCLTSQYQSSFKPLCHTGTLLMFLRISEL